MFTFRILKEKILLHSFVILKKKFYIGKLI